ncbi:hypothetical protein, variant [Fonticula alba]|nr:hypothetical protein, variant [Fonticula alba]KCV70424.1 hypothetical protein, variant [Fonticula alba]|eukprot:XP_009494940.1 hypothetical protein, variant [Fonticula alba]
MQALLFAMGLTGSTNAIDIPQDAVLPLAATLNWILKDGLGQLGGVIYAAVSARSFDSEPKRQRFASGGVWLPAATLLECTAPLAAPVGLFVPLAALAGAMKNVSWIATSAARAQLHRTMTATRRTALPGSHTSGGEGTADGVAQNLGDVTAKAGAQTTSAATIGTGVGVGAGAIVQWLASSFETTFALSTGQAVSAATLAVCAPLLVLSTYALFRSNACVVLDNLDEQRFRLAIGTGPANYRASNPGPRGQGLEWLVAPVPTVLGPAAVARLERFVRPGHLADRLAARVDVNPDVNQWFDDQADPADAWARCFGSGQAPCDRRYFLHLRSRPPAFGRGRVGLWLDAAAGPADVFRGYLHASLLAKALDSAGPSPTDGGAKLIAETAAVLPRWQAAFLAAGWRPPSEGAAAHLETDPTRRVHINR